MSATLNINSPQLQVGSSFGLGLWSIETLYYSDDFNGTSCSSWSNTLSSYILDAPWNAARAFAIGADICIGIATIACIMMTCVAMPILVIKMTACLFFLAFLFVIAKN